MAKFRWDSIATVVALGVLDFALFCAVFVPAPVDSSDWAAWVQGVGTVAAVGVSAWAGAFPATMEARRLRDGRADFMRGLQHAVSHLDQDMQALATPAYNLDIAGVDLAVRHMVEGAALDTLRRLLDEPATAWPSVYLRVMASEHFRAIMAMGRFTSAPNTADKAELEAWWEAFRAGVTREDAARTRLLHQINRDLVRLERRARPRTEV
jgi:hypothetical protein